MEQEGSSLTASRLSGYGKPQKSADSNQSSSKFLYFFKIFLLIFAVILAVVTFSWSFFTKQDYTNMPTVDLEESLKQNELVNPRFDSTDSKGQPYSLTAISASQDDETGAVILREPAGDINLLSGRWLSIKAIQGVYHDEKKELELLEDVQLSDDTGYVMDMAHMFIDFTNNVMRVDAPITGNGPAGTLSAVGAQSDLNKEILIFKGPAKLKINASALDGGLGSLR